LHIDVLSHQNIVGERSSSAATGLAGRRIEQVLKREFRAKTTAKTGEAAEAGAEGVASTWVETTGPGVGIKCGLAELVELLLLFRVGEDFIGSLDLLKFFARIGFL
jgi:hypothetical protein